MKPAGLLRPRRPHALFDEVPADRQAVVARSLIDALGSTRATWSDACARQLRKVALADFYDALATENAARADDWLEMGRVQRQFQDAEPSFDARTRAYSESMRLTLHAATLLHLHDVVDVPADRHFFERFLELHVTAFFENGAWFGNMHVTWCGALDVLGATRLSMLAHIKDLHDGQFVSDPHVVHAAQLVRAARRTALRP